jgi:predicted NodU family carbamoyl transferase
MSKTALITVNRNANPRYWRLIKAFEGLMGVPVVLNTSFNENEPIVHSIRWHRAATDRT